MALTYAVGKGWLAQLEVDVDPGRAIGQSSVSVTDLDVLALAPDEFQGYRRVVFDCKTRAKESPVNRAIWLAGLLDRVRGDHGVCILKRSAIEPDHALLADRMRVTLLTERGFALYARVTNGSMDSSKSLAAQIALWEQYFSVSTSFPRLEHALRFLRSAFWMADEPAEACRKCIAVLRRVAPELDPVRPEHRLIFCEFCTLIAQSLASVVCRMFKVYLHPHSAGELAEALLMMLYGGKETYRYRLSVFKLLSERVSPSERPDLVLPEWERFVQLTRQFLDSPLEAQRTPMLLREVGFAQLVGGADLSFARSIAARDRQTPKFAMLVASYAAHAAALPKEFSDVVVSTVIPLVKVT
ncbi:MAG: hypothetical protein KIS66_16620 [Fimbriimonadaceae bacterium]|nr:hypothetical protein [Fimbriimonadaceae bacterium]